MSDNKFKIIFYRDREQDKNDTYEFFRDEDPANWLDRASYYMMPFHIVHNLVNKKVGAKEELFDFMDKEYDMFEKFNLYSYAEEETNKLWDNISDKFSERIEELTSRKLDNYRCLLTMFITTSAWNKDTNIRKNIKQLLDEKYVVAYELLLSHAFKCVRDYYSEEDIASSWDVWGFAEVTSTFLFRDEIIMNMLPDFSMPLEKTFFGMGAYPCLIEVEEVLKKFWIGRKSFKDYVDRSVEYLKKNPIVF